MDQFIVEFMIQYLQKQVKENKLSALAAFENLETVFGELEGRVEGLESIGIEIDGSINTLRQQYTDLETFTTVLAAEVNKMKSLSLKQGMSIRTFHNQNAYKADDIYIDTFNSSENIDFALSTRTEWMSDLGAVGRIRDSMSMVEQLFSGSALLVSANGVSDSGISQSFVTDKNRRMNKVSLHLTKFSEETSQPIMVRLRQGNTGTDLSVAEVAASSVTGGWIDIELPAYDLIANQTYFIVLETADLRGYRIGMHPTDRYMTGTSYSRYEGIWTDNNHDIGFKIWMFPSDDENSAVVVSKKTVYPTRPVAIIFEKEDVMENGTVVYHVSRDNGINWKLLQPGVPTDLDDLPTGTELLLRASVTGESRVEAWSYVIVRGDS